MLAPMVLLFLACVTMAVVPQRAVGLFSGVVDQVLGQEAGDVLQAAQAGDAPLAALGSINAWACAAMALAAGGLLHLTRRAATGKGPNEGPAAGPTWACGYVRPTVRMQYTGRSLAETFAEHLLPRFLRPKTSCRLPQGLFPAAGEFGSTSADFFTERVYRPLFARWAARCLRLRILQQGKTHVYLLYIMFMVVLALTWVSLRTWWRPS
jgi:hypothetical protein